MLHEFSRTELLIGKKGLQTLQNAKVAVFGIGGVGSFVVEGLVRAGVGSFILIDDDKVCKTNINRQLIALHSTVGRPKVDVMEERIYDINPRTTVEKHQMFYLPDTPFDTVCKNVDYIVDAVDTVSAKISLVMNAYKRNIPIISSMGTGNKINPAQFEVADLYDTSVCPLSKVMRRELKKRGIPSLKVVYSKEEPLTPREDEAAGCSKNCICPEGTVKTCTKRRQIPGSISFAPSVAGLIIASEVVKDLLKKE